MTERIKLKLTDGHPFTKRQAEIINVMANGSTQSEAANELGIARETVRSHFYGRWGIFNRIRENYGGNRLIYKGWIMCLLSQNVLQIEDEQYSGATQGSLEISSLPAPISKA